MRRSDEIECQPQEHVDRYQHDALEPRRLSIVRDSVHRKHYRRNGNELERARKYEIQWMTGEPGHQHEQGRYEQRHLNR